MKYLCFLPKLAVLFFLLTGCSTANKADPLEGYNRAMYSTNKVIDKYTLKPISKSYQAITPKPVKTSIHNFYSNILEINTFANSMLQGKFHQAGMSSARFVWNTTAGIFGLFDVASAMNINAQREDFGLTLRTWGVPEGPYFIIPLAGPSTITDTAGWTGDYLMSPISYWNWTDNNSYRLAFDSLGVIELRSTFLETEKSLSSISNQVDEYSLVRDIYLQRRRNMASDGAIVNTPLDDDVDKIIDGGSK